MNCLYTTLYFKIVAGIIQTVIKSWNQFLYPRVIEICRFTLNTQMLTALIQCTSKWKSFQMFSSNSVLLLNS